MFRHFGIRGTDEFLDSLYKESLEKTSKIYPPIFYPKVIELLNFLKVLDFGLMSVISAHPQKRLDDDFKKFDIYHLFDTIKGSCHNKTSFIEDIIMKSKINLDNTIYIGDTKSDMVSANAANITPVGVTYGYQTKQQVLEGKPKRLFSNVEDLSNYLFERI